jgi:membrane protease YdiL (CAAX protease family)
VSSKEQDFSTFGALKGNVPRLVLLLALSWMLAAVGEELAYRGYLLTRVRQVLGGGRLTTVVAVCASSFLFGLAHSVQGLIGVLAVAAFFLLGPVPLLVKAADA